MKKLFFAFDLDGTILNRYNEIEDKIIEALKLARAQGHILAIATGRGLPGSLELIKKYPYFDYIIANNGTLIYNVKEKTTIDKGSLDVQTIKLLIEDCKASKSICAISSLFNLYKYAPEDNYPWLKEQHIMDIHVYKKIEFQEIENVLATEKINQIALRNSESEIKKLYQKWSDKLAGIYKTTITNKIFLDVNPLSVDKYFGIKLVLDSLNLDESCLVTFGDSSNDFLMIRHAYYGFAMPYSTPDIEEVATKVLKPDFDVNSKQVQNPIASQVSHILANIANFDKLYKSKK
ncbi:COF family HAD hydrolase protein [Mesomycoplasma conjunctivae]|uniref:HYPOTHETICAL Uncharacterized protein yxeH n=1 Tax=Mesomycoplasma conjunctivae (strain ATCC 25834 / NCTC 10147 / HRC/581) TaxID=572263 RepID=C5J6A9_MESCH|nr:HAD family hydrolase [Mesomycoplasma conjunctivae]CAT05001.1 HYPOTHETICAL Uncharacterized protein yxeH [Mesomycoplasma conjunctivae]VEU66338.1 COF family HAD hydrolase protein [Mesomycoplasma conjunctivae]